MRTVGVYPDLYEPGCWMVHLYLNGELQERFFHTSEYAAYRRFTALLGL